jgi:hypothetical protein
MTPRRPLPDALLEVGTARVQLSQPERATLYRAVLNARRDASKRLEGASLTPDERRILAARETNCTRLLGILAGGAIVPPAGGQ